MNGHGGNLSRMAEQLGCRPDDILDFSANINPLGPPPFLRRLINKHVADLVHYPDPDCNSVVTAIASVYGLDSSRIVVGNGTSELLFLLPSVIQARRAVIPGPSYIDYERACRQADIPVCHTELCSEKDSFTLDVHNLEPILKAGDLVILGQPNNPTGRLIDRCLLTGLIERNPEVMFLIDEAFAGFSSSYRSLAGCADNLIVLCSLTKIYAIPGLRLGFVAGSPTVCKSLKNKIAPWTVNTLAQVIGAACLEKTDYIDKSRQLVESERKFLLEQIGNFPELYPYRSHANFLLVRIENCKYSGSELAEVLLHKHRIAVRTCGNYHALDERYIRIAVRTRPENERLIRALETVLRPGRQRVLNSRPKKPALMLLGTGSDVGKSVLVAALGRILLQDGLRVAPFKAQNMSLNSYVTRDGGEMGRAQVVQAQACRLDPDVRMNPVLLKPCSDVGSQVIVHGRPVGNMKVSDYVVYKKEAWAQVCQAYDSLAREYDVLLLEGAGSPGEVNLKSHDIVNTRMARYAGAQALLVGDIDRGGVYASFIGHVDVMDGWERDLIAGFIVNRFRGDRSLLEDAHDYLLEHTGKPVLGVVPYLSDLGLPQEDSVSFKAGLFSGKNPSGAHVEVAVIDLPHISNFTDIEPLFGETDVYLRIVSKPGQLGRPDAILLPGSKNVPADINWIHASGLGESIVALSAAGVEIVGICGGFQMLGRRITDPHGLEGRAGESCPGLGLLDMETALAAEKTLTRKEGLHLVSGCRVKGYEIHHGITQGRGASIISFDDGSSCGQGDADALWGSYLHGIFDADGFRRWWLDRLRVKKGLAPLTGVGTAYDLEPALDRLAEEVRKHLDMKAVYSLLNL